MLWLNSFSLLLVPLALASRRLTWCWAVPWVLWFVDPRAYDASLASMTLVWLIAAVTLGSLWSHSACVEPRRAPTLQRVIVEATKI
jgi:hypothetical protein